MLIPDSDWEADVPWRPEHRQIVIATTAHARQAIRSKPHKLTAPIRREIEAKLRQMRWSPEQICGWLSEQGTEEGRQEARI